ncbi:MAG: hypothetical protein IJ597_00255 [Synergistaceae bacterium]|nr:hypothetical protein [Synergistaceae bacterium]
MPANIIVFDAEYTSEVVRNIEKANSLIDDAVKTLRHANSHRAWRCPEVKQISDNIENISSRLKRLDRGLSATTSALTKGRDNFKMLETRSQRQADKLSENLRENYGFSAQVRGKEEKTNLPVTEVPKSEDNFIVKAIKGTARNIIQGLGTAFGTVIGLLGNGINKAGEGFLTDLKDAFIDPIVNIFKSSYELGEAFKKQSLGEIGTSLGNIAINSVKLIGSTLGLGGDLAEKGIKLGKLNNFSETTELIGTVYGEGGNAFDAGNAIGEVIKDPGKTNEAQNQFMGMITDYLVPFGLDQTLIQGVKGVAEGAKDGATVGYNLANMLCNFLGL